MEIKREIGKDLLQWVSATGRKPLLLRGARQSGKSYLVQKVLGSSFERVVTVNFERDKSYGSCFADTLDPKVILSRLEALLGRRITPGRDLLFLDELQDCPEAITAMRYFYEELPEQHVVGAGSLLEFILGKVSFPVGRVTVRYLGPITFDEFLIARGHEELKQQIDRHDFKKPLNEALHNAALRLLREFMAIGGMPEAVSTFLETQSFHEVERVQGDILELFQADLPRYSKRQKELEYISQVFAQVPQRVGEQVKYVSISREIRAQYIKACLVLLEQARVISFVRPTAGYPLRALAKEHPLKLLFLDIGLMQRACGLSIGRWVDQGETLMNNGPLAEQFVGQSLLSYRSQSRPELYYWRRDKRGSSAEVDYLMESEGKITPLEVKAGASGKMRSLLLYLKKFPESNEGVKFSAENFSVDRGIRTVPLYALGAWLRRVEGG